VRNRFFIQHPFYICERNDCNNLDLANYVELSMKKFEIPEFYRSPIISRVKAKRKLDDLRKKDFTPTVLDFGVLKFNVARHFGFCYGVENAIEIAYRAIDENPGKNIYLLSQMIHNPSVNDDLESHGIKFIQNTDGDQMVSWDEINANDVVIVPAFGATVEIVDILTKKGVNIEKYNTTCPFVEKVWNRSEKLGQDKYTIIIHGKHNHEETRATFSHSSINGPALVVKNMEETKVLSNYILGNIDTRTFLAFFDEKFSSNFNPEKDLMKIGVVNQTTMLASETQQITDYLKETMIQKYGESDIKEHIAETRDTLCYATNDNQTATYGLMEMDADLAIVVGGYNSSNTTHLVELLEQKFPTYFIKSEDEIKSFDTIHSFNIHSKALEIKNAFLSKEHVTIAITSGASCPDAIIDKVMQRILKLKSATKSIDEVIEAILV